VPRTSELLAALMGAQAGGLLATPPGLDGEPGLGIPGISGVPRGRTWDVVASAHAPDLTGEAATFVALADGTLVTDEDLPDESLVPLANAIEERLPPPYRAAAIRHDGDVWSAVAESVVIAELPGLDVDVVDLTVVAGERTLTIDDEPTIREAPELDVLAEGHGDVAVHAERVDGDLFAVDVFSL
jgi:hypothetical protein